MVRNENIITVLDWLKLKIVKRLLVWYYEVYYQADGTLEQIYLTFHSLHLIQYSYRYHIVDASTVSFTAIISPVVAIINLFFHESNLCFPK